MTDLSQFIDPDLSTNDILHSNGYGVAAGGGGMGGLSMERRRQLMNQPRIVGAYSRSILGRQGSSYKARTADQKGDRAYDASRGTFVDDVSYGRNRQNNALSENKVERNIERRQHFIEPPARKYDPYA